MFKKRYDNDPEFREKHKKYMRERVVCSCGKKVVRNYLSKHKKTKLHTKTSLENGIIEAKGGKSVVVNLDSIPKNLTKIEIRF